MANDESALREVDQELAEEQQWAQFRKHGPLVIGAAVAVVLGVAGWQGWTHMKTSAAEEDALEYRSALELLGEDQDQGRAALQAVAGEKSGYGALAALQAAGSYASGGERLKAMEIYRSVANGNAPKRIRELAQLRASYLALVDGRDAVMAELGPLAEAEGRYGYYAREVMGLAALGAKDYETALSNFRLLSIDVGAPDGIRDRAEEFASLAAAAKAGVNISGEVRVEDLLNLVGEEESAAAGDTETGDASIEDAVEAAPLDESAVDEGEHNDHDGHDHEE